MKLNVLNFMCGCGVCVGRKVIMLVSVNVLIGMLMKNI